jgi:hypothetical protein
MSQRLIDLNPDLKRLRDEGYHVEIVAGHLVIREVPYLTASGEVRRGVLVSELEMNGEKTTTPRNHVALWAGECPCDNNGKQLNRVVNSASRKVIDDSLTVDFLLSSKHRDRAYHDYHEKMTRYIDIFESYAQAIASVTSKTFPPIRTDETESVFWYLDTASSRAGITSVSRYLALPAIAIIGVGGTGSYVLDFVSKTPAREIHLFDADRFANHNAFRSPGAASLEDLDARPFKVDYFAQHYSRMHRHIVPHRYYIDQTNVSELYGMTFVFICLDKGGPKDTIVKALTNHGIPFVDVGMGLQLDSNGRIGGQVRSTTSSSELRDHIIEKRRISFGEPAGENEYGSNIQIAELNALNAALAVIKWKKLFGFYRDLEHEHYSVYDIDGNCVTNDDRACGAL